MLTVKQRKSAELQGNLSTKVPKQLAKYCLVLYIDIYCNDIHSPSKTTFFLFDTIIIGVCLFFIFGIAHSIQYRYSF